MGGALEEPFADQSRGRLSELEDQLKETLSTLWASGLDEGQKAVVKLKTKNDHLDKPWRDTKAYWEDHLNNSIQLEMLANEHLRKFKAKTRNKEEK
ncbi:OLC1v1024602C1 [Oldenlandia corymbosa var. corymbosa]|uniref:OLC1v1024602C1 n=1 Tax=Oldenlandia corymbosa var. corymbosa TaxID=529605 RepID=A0AAV1C3N2_OLDCO|nr:OLC1v1024602C1 [Oldenlandia corymbosa var. corymbosa]